MNSIPFLYTSKISALKKLVSLSILITIFLSACGSSNTAEESCTKTITVQYFEETANDKGGISLRFPTVKQIYDNERDM